jgi:2'-5' RNA ligase
MARDRASRPEAKSLRLFVAFELPDDAQRAIDEAVAPLRRRFAQARWVPTENRHVTVKFLGQTWPRLRGAVDEQVGIVAAGAAPVPTRLTTIGSFPNGRRARVLWAGLADPDDRLARLSEALDEALARDFERETRAYTPHCTVARSDPPLHLDDADLDVRLEPVAFSVGEIVVFGRELV